MSSARRGVASGLAHDRASAVRKFRLNTRKGPLLLALGSVPVRAERPRIAFDHQVLRQEQGALVLARYGRKIRFRKQAA